MTAPVQVDPRLRWDEPASGGMAAGPHPVTRTTGASVLPETPRRLTSVELFAGAGGLALGCELAGFRSLATLEWNRWACDTIEENQAAGHALVKDWQVFRGDVRNFDWSTIKDAVDIVSGGPPCQPFSAGGRARAADDPRDMFPATAEIISQLRPRAFIIENVRGLTREAFADYYEYILRRLAKPELRARTSESWYDHLVRLRTHRSRQGDLLYDVVPTLLNAADFGVPQQRHRVVMVGFRADLGVQWTFPRQTHSRAALLHEQWITGEYWDEHEVAKKDRPERPSASTLRIAAKVPEGTVRWRTLRDALVGLPDPRSAKAVQFANHDFQPGARSYKGHTGSPLDEPAKALKAGGHGVPGGENMIRFADGTVRYLTIRESARVQTFPDDYRLHGAWGEAMRQLGNAVPVHLGQAVANHVHAGLTPTEKEHS